MAEDKSKAAPDEWGDDVAAFLPLFDFGKGPFVGKVLTSRIAHDVIGAGGEPRDVPVFDVEDETGGKWTIFGSGMLSRVLPEHIGHRVKITDKGLSPQGDGTSLRVFEVRCATDAAAV